MQFPRALAKLLWSFVLVNFMFLGIFCLEQAVPDQFYIKNIVAALGSGSALYYLFCSRAYLSKVTTLYSFFLSSCGLFIFTDVQDPDLSVFILLSLSGSFFFSFFLHSNRKLDAFFVFLVCCFLTLIHLEWAIAFLVEFIILFCFEVFQRKHIKNKEVFLAFSLLLLLCFYFSFLGVHPGFRIGVVFLFGAAGAGGLQFLCLNKTEWAQGAGFFLYCFSNMLLGMLLQKEGETFPKSTLFFLMTICFGLLFVYLVSRVKDESLSSVITGSKNLLRGAFFPLLYLLNGLFFDGAYFLWITSFIIHVFILLLFKFILQNAEEDPILENEEKG